MLSPLVSIQVPSNRLEKIIIFLDHLQNTANDLSSFEVIFNLDEDDTVISEALEKEKLKRPFSVRYIKTFTGGFYNSWKPNNDMLACTHPNAYFITFMSDEFLFKTKGWDDILKSYVDYYPDGIFRLRASRFRYRNYIDFWECGFAPDGVAFYTKNWANINNDWGPCFSSDAFQQFVAYYFSKSEPFNKEQDNRDIPIPNLEFSGEGASIGLEGEKAKERVRGGIKAWFRLVSYPMQLEAARRGMLLRAQIIAYTNDRYKIIENVRKKQIQIIDDATGNIKRSYSYKLNPLNIYLKNQFRKLKYLYYAGGSYEENKGRSPLFHLTYYLAMRYPRLESFHDKCNVYEYRIRSFFGMELGREKQETSRSSDIKSIKTVKEYQKKAKPFFFISTYDKLSAEILQCLLNIHPEIQCGMMNSGGYLSQSVSRTIDQFIDANTNKDKKFSGNVGNFPAFELQLRMLAEKTKQPFKKVQILVAPILRVRFLMYSWLQSGESPDKLFKRLHEELLQRFATDPVFIKYNVSNYYSSILQSVIFNLDKFKKQQATRPDPALEKSLVSLAHPYSQIFYIALALVVAFDSADLPCTARKFQLDKLLASEAEFSEMIQYITNNELSLTPDLLAQFKATTQNISGVFNAVGNCFWDHIYTDFLNTFLNAKLTTIYSPHINKTLAQLYDGYNYPLFAQKPFQPEKLLSIQLNSNRPAQISAYFDNIEETADRPQDIEVVVNIDVDDAGMKKLLDTEIHKRKFTLKYIESPRPASFFDLWKPLNQLFAASNPQAYFLLNISDEMFFLTKGWDTILRKYVGFFPDHIFRLRASRNKFKNYFDRWECNFIQDSIPFTTRKWVEIGGDWNPCFGPDSFQQLVAFYLAKDSVFSNENMLREIPIIDIKFAGDVPAVGINPEKQWKMVSQAVRAMQICQSYKMQLEACRRAMLLRANIFLEARAIKSNVKLIDLKKKKAIQILVDDKPVEEFSYKLSWLRITLTNQLRKIYFFSYFGGGLATRPNPLSSFIYYLMSKHKFVFVPIRNLTNAIFYIQSQCKKPFKLFKKSKKVVEASN